MRHHVVAVLICLDNCAMSLGADGPPQPLAGHARLPSGRDIEYVLHFDRNSLQSSLRLSSGLLALTSSGVLVRFELPSYRSAREQFEAGEVTCLCRGKGEEALVGLADGRVCRVNPLTLELVELFRFSASVAWIGWGEAVGVRPAGLVIVTRPTKPVERYGRHWDVPYLVIHDMPRGRRTHWMMNERHFCSTSEPGSGWVSTRVNGVGGSLGLIWIGGR